MLVTVVTATTGRDSLLRCIASVAQQTHADIQHIIMADGPPAHSKVKQIGYNASIKGFHKHEVIEMPRIVGADRWNGHRMYAAATFLAEGEYVMYLDDDNYIDANHIKSCIAAVTSGQYGWGWSLRKVIDANGVECNDDCESLGPDYPTILHKDDRLVDVNCYFIHRNLAVFVTPIWYRKAREPNVMEVDRALVKALAATAPGIGTGKYTVNYTTDSTGISVSSSFFIRGNEEMAKRYPEGFPWRK
jgi:hypothetical protein